MCWELLAVLLCLADFTDNSSSSAGDKRPSANHVPLSSSAPRYIERGVGQDSGISHRTRLGIRSIVNERTESASKAGLGGIIGDGIRTENRISFGTDSLASVFGVLSSSGGNSAQSGGDSGSSKSEPDVKYLVVKVDLMSPNATDLSTLIEPLLREVEQLLATGFARETFQLTWLTYVQ